MQQSMTSQSNEINQIKESYQNNHGMTMRQRRTYRSGSLQGRYHIQQGIRSLYAQCREGLTDGRTEGRKGQARRRRRELAWSKRAGQEWTIIITSGFLCFSKTEGTDDDLLRRANLRRPRESPLSSAPMSRSDRRFRCCGNSFRLASILQATSLSSPVQSRSSPHHRICSLAAFIAFAIVLSTSLAPTTNQLTIRPAVVGYRGWLVGWLVGE